MVRDLTLAGTPQAEQTFESLVAIDETGVGNSGGPTVVAACFLHRGASEATVRALLDCGVKPWFQKSSDLESHTLEQFFEELSIPTRAQATWGTPDHGQRGLMAIEAAKDVIPAGVGQYSSTENCLLLLDGRPSNYGGDTRLLQARNEILDQYFEDQHGLHIEVATLERADRRYPEMTTADCACKLISNRLTGESRIEDLDGVSRFDQSRSVPSVNDDGRVFELAPHGVARADAFRSKVAAWVKGERPAESELGTVSPQELERLAERHLTDDVVTQYITDTETG